MDDPQLDPSYGVPPKRSYRPWLWIGGVLGCLFLLTVLAIVGLAASAVGVINQTATAYSGTATVSAATQVRMAELGGTARAVEQRFAEPPAGWKSTIDETFSSSRYGWDLTAREVDGSGVNAFVRDREYIYNVNSLSSGTQIFIERPEDLLDVTVDEFFLSVEARQNNIGAEGDSYGLVLRQLDDDSYILLHLSNQGEACVVTFGSASEQVVGPCAQYYHQPWRMNRLTVVAYQGSYHFLVDDRFIGSIDDLPLRKGRVGIFVGVNVAPANFVFDNFKLYVPPD